MKKVVIIIIIIISIIACSLGIISFCKIHKNNESIKNVEKTQSFNTTNKIKTSLTLEDEIQENTIWCGTFQLIWNDLKNDLAKKDIEFTPQLKVVENLNKETFNKEDISEEYYYKKVGRPSTNLKEEIETAIKEKFNETSDILNDFDWSNRNPNDYFLYAMLKKEFKFENEFEKLDNSTFGKYNNVSYFGISPNNTNDSLRNQVKVLYYNSNENFAIKLNTKQEDEVVLCKNPEGTTFNEIYKNIKKSEENYDGNKTVQEDESVKIPNLKIKEKSEFKEIENQFFKFSNGELYLIEKALQTIEFQLDKSGGKIKSEAGMMVKDTAVIMSDKIREFNINDSFTIFLKEKDKDVPYFAAKIDDITKFQ